MFSLRLAERRTLLILADLLLVNATTLVAIWIQAVRGGFVFNRAYILDKIEWFLLFSALWVFSAFLNGFYDPQRITDLARSVAGLARTIGLIILAYLVIYFYLAIPNSFPRVIVVYQGTISFILISLSRIAYVLLSQQPAFARKVIIVGAGWAGETIAEAILRHARALYQIVGFVDDAPEKQGQTIQLPTSNFQPPMRHSSLVTRHSQFSILGTSRDLVRLVKVNNVPEVILAVTYDISTPLFQVILDCQEQGVQITQMAVLFEQLTGRVPIEHIGDNWNVALPLDSAEASGFYPIAKRAFDVVGALVGLALFLPMLPFILLAIRWDSPGPVFYAHARVGKGGKVFKLIKLRTMVVDAEKEGHALRAQANDPRTTRVGKWLRRMRLDEMPQLFNILKGDMSAVGPRPERPEHLRELDEQIPFHRLRNAVKPGMAGWAVVNYDYIDSLEDAKIRLQYDLYYIKHQSIWLDLLILVRTMGHMLALKGR